MGYNHNTCTVVAELVDVDTFVASVVDERVLETVVERLVLETVVEELVLETAAETATDVAALVFATVVE